MTNIHVSPDVANEIVYFADAEPTRDFYIVINIRGGGTESTYTTMADYEGFKKLYGRLPDGKWSYMHR
jgi:hypothetical protein